MADPTQILILDPAGDPEALALALLRRRAYAAVLPSEHHPALRHALEAAGLRVRILADEGEAELTAALGRGVTAFLLPAEAPRRAELLRAAKTAGLPVLSS